VEENMDVIINEVVSSVRLVDGQALLDPKTLSSIVRTVLSAVDERDARASRRAEETQIPDDGRGGLSGMSGGY
jgi:hypothetical protein